MRTRRLIILGSTGSIGTQTLDAVAHLNTLAERGETPERFDVVGLAAGSRGEELAEQARRFGVRDVALADAEAAFDVPGVTVRRSGDSAEELVREVEADIVMAAIVGVAGLPATLAGVELGRDVALANKETLVAAGPVVTAACARSGSHLLPVDSEHAALWQCLLALRDLPRDVPPFVAPPSLVRATLTASGGPFRTSSADQIRNATREQALAHPTWSMGPKVTTDSASLMNKGLELIEAHWLFGLGTDRLAVLVHPQSTVHAMAEFADGSVISQLGAPDMRSPISYALTHPARPVGCARTLDLAGLGRLDFEPPDTERFPALELAMGVIDAGGSAGAVLNAANEIAVAAFLRSDESLPQIAFGQIPEIVATTLSAVASRPVTTLAEVMQADAEAREVARGRLG